jgi:hypothetical protein
MRFGVVDVRPPCIPTLQYFLQQSIEDVVRKLKLGKVDHSVLYRYHDGRGVGYVVPRVRSASPP